jgi:hypothetical protein
MQYHGKNMLDKHHGKSMLDRQTFLDFCRDHGLGQVLFVCGAWPVYRPPVALHRAEVLHYVHLDIVDLLVSLNVLTRVDIILP